MGQIKFARIDARLIHGQVATAWSNSVGINSIYVVDNPTATDEFTKMLYTSLQNNYSFKIKVLTVENAVEEWENNKLGTDEVMLLFKDVEHAFKAVKNGLPFGMLNIGGSPKKDNNKLVADSVALTKDEFEKLKKIKNDYNVDVYFQVMPSSTKKVLDKVEW